MNYLLVYQRTQGNKKQQKKCINNVEISDSGTWLVWTGLGWGEDRYFRILATQTKLGGEYVQLCPWEVSSSSCHYTALILVSFQTSLKWIIQTLFLLMDKRSLSSPCSQDRWGSKSVVNLLRESRPLYVRNGHPLEIGDSAPKACCAWRMTQRLHFYRTATSTYLKRSTPNNNRAD